MNTINPMIAVIPAKADHERQSWLPLWLHLQDTANVMTWLFSEWLSEEARKAMLPDYDASSARSLISVIALLHDFGKATPVFAAHIARTAQMSELTIQMEGAGFPPFWPKEYVVTHAAAGEMLLYQAGMEVGFASVIGAHHGKPQGGDFDPETIWINHAHLLAGRKQDGDAWTRVQNELLRHAQVQAGVDITSLKPLPQSSLVLLSGLLIMADWIASNTRYFPLLQINDDGRSIDTDQRFLSALNHLKLPPCWQTEADTAWGADIYDLRFGQGETPFIPRATQREVAQITAAMESPGIMILEAPMGSGKTEAALAAAELISARTGSGGIFFGLPTQATANALFDRVMAWAQRQSEDAVQTIQLCHRMATLNPDYRDLLEGVPEDVMVAEDSGLEIHSFFMGKKTALLASFVVGTVDQLLMAALSRKHVMLRQLGLAGKVIIVDEVHAYDAYMGQYLKRVLQWLGAWHTPVILLSATLPTNTRSQLMDAYLGKSKTNDDCARWRRNVQYPLLTWSDNGKIYQRELTGDGRSNQVRIQMITDEARVELLRELLSEGGCAGVICNTVDRAQALAQQITQEMDDVEVILCHARFVMPQRTQIEERLLKKLGRKGKRPFKMVLVGTQVIEQSLDIDLDVLISDLCPVDLLLQRIGRLHRHERIRPRALCAAQCFVTACEEEAIEKQKIYEPYLLLRTLQALPDQVTIPGDIAPLVERVYGQPSNESPESERLIAAREKMTQHIRDQENRASVYRLKPPARSSRYAPACLHGLLDINATGDDITAEASVRDSSASLEVLLLRRVGDSDARPVGEELVVSLNRVPATEEAIVVARQRLKLPWVLCAPNTIDKTIAELERRTENAAPEWKHSPWLQGELLLLIEEDGTTDLNGYILRYDDLLGLICEKNNER